MSASFYLYFIHILKYFPAFIQIYLKISGQIHKVEPQTFFFSLEDKIVLAKLKELRQHLIIYQFSIKSLSHYLDLSEIFLAEWE